MLKTILIIENDDITRSILVDFLELKGFSVLSAGDGFSGLQLAKKSQPNLIICDLIMPGLDGFCVLKKLREDVTTSKIPFIFLTADNNSDSYLRAMELGANDYLIKPIDIHILFNEITNQLQLMEYINLKGKCMDLKLFDSYYKF